MSLSQVLSRPQGFNDMTDIYKNAYGLKLTIDFPHKSSDKDNVLILSYNQLFKVAWNIHYFCEHYKISELSLYNSYNYSTYLGNFAHAMSDKICEIILNFSDSDNLIELVMPYIHILYLFVMYNYIDLKQQDYYEHTPLRSWYFNINVHLEQCAFNPTLNLKENQAILSIHNIMKKILDPKYDMLVTAQSYIRRWLARRTVRKLMLRRALDSIMFAPPTQVELCNFPNFPGGQSYHNMSNTFNNAQVDELVNLCIPVN